MTGAELYQLTTDILDGETINEDFFYQLLNIAKVRLEESRAWNFLKKLDESNTGSIGGNNLPADFGRDYKVLVGMNNEYLPVPFEDQHLYRSASHRYYIDLGNSLYYLTGTPINDTIYFYYLRFTPDITSATSPVFPSRFHAILSFYVSGYYQAGVDSDDLFARMSPENKAQAIQLQQSMVVWDTNLSARSRNNQIGIANSEIGVDLSQM